MKGKKNREYINIAFLYCREAEVPKDFKLIYDLEYHRHVKSGTID